MSTRKSTRRKKVAKPKLTPRWQVGAWEVENRWNRAERCRVFLAIMGFISFSQAENIRERIAKDFRKPNPKPQ